MAESRVSSAARFALWGVLAFSLLVLIVQVIIVRPRLWPAGIGATFSGDTVLASLSEPRPIVRIRPPDVTGVLGTPLVVTMVAPVGEAQRLGLTTGTAVDLVLDRAASIRPTAQVAGSFPTTPEQVLDVWRQAYRRDPTAPVPITDRSSGQTSLVTPVPVWDLDAALRGLWLRQHLGVLVQTSAFLAGALVLAFLGARGMTATLMTLALIATAIANGGPMFGAELSVPVIGNLLLLFGWLVTPLTFPIIGLAVLFFPTPAAILDRHRWIYAAMAAVAAPMFVISLLAAAFLLQLDAARAPLAWFAMHGWIFDVSFALALGVNVLIVIEGINRYRSNLDMNERRRIQLVVYSGVPAVFAYAVKAGVPLLSSLAGNPIELPWPIEAVLQLIVLFPAVALPYAVAVKRIFSPRTVVRRGMQYAFARRTLSVLAALPILVLVFSLISERDQPLGDIILERPWLYAISLALAAAGFRYRVQAQRWLDKQFFRAEYDAKEILVSLANRVPYESDPAQLISLVLSQIDNAVQPKSIAVLVGEGSQLEVVSELRTSASPLRLDGGLATLLRWSDDPLEVFLDDDRSPAARLPPADKTWLATTGAALLVPIFGGTGDGRSLAGLIALGERRSEEPYTPEDRRLLSGIAAQLSVAHDLSRLRRRLSTGERQQSSAPVTPTMIAGTNLGELPALAMCPECHRCFDLAGITSIEQLPKCPDHNLALQAVIGMPAIVDGKYRIDAVVGRGGMGAVFRARDLRLERDVAVKVVRAEVMANPESRARFQREAQIVARLQHPGIVTVFDYGNLVHGAAFLVMEFVAGEDLRHLLKREHTLAPDRVVELLSGIASGVDAAHRAGVLHRDLKPENILLPASGSGPKVLDFGVAKMTATSSEEGGGVTLTQGVTIVGTPAYMAPEQLRGDSLDPRADVFSLGVMTYEALTGRLPFGAGSFFDVGMKQAEGPFRVEFGELAPPLIAALRQALALDRDERPATAGAFVELLRVRPSLPPSL